jgi:hypothetical protein
MVRNGSRTHGSPLLSGAHKGLFPRDHFVAPYKINGLHSCKPKAPMPGIQQRFNSDAPHLFSSCFDLLGTNSKMKVELPTVRRNQIMLHLLGLKYGGTNLIPILRVGRRMN